MPSLNPYLTFNGNCEQAFTFYQSVFGGEFPYLGRFKDMPPGAAGEGHEVPEDAADKIMHVSLPINDNCVLMGSDTFPGQVADVGNNFSISISCDDRAEVDKFFNALSEGGNVVMPLADTFWNSYFGMLIDQFGIQWMVSCELAPAEGQ